MKKSNIYLQRYAYPSIGLHQQIKNNPDIIVVIPAYAEQNIATALRSLHDCSKPIGEVSVIIVINEPDNAKESISTLNKRTFEEAEGITKTFEQFTINLKLPPKKAGVGLARKIGMDEAVRCFEENRKDGIIVCYDADCTCAPNYLQVIEDFFSNPEHKLGMVHYEHDLNGPNSEAIILYELFLRYYINALRIIQYPNALQTLGSCITVKSKAYQKQGGMNTRKAGEDFYFIHKMVPLGGLGEINNTTIFPSDRTSERVPFGTGFAINNYLKSPDQAYPSYSPKIFEDLKVINLNLEEIYYTRQLPKYPESVARFYSEHHFSIAELISQSGSFENFLSRYYSWWDGFRVLKFVHFCRDEFYPNEPLSNSMVWLDQYLKTGLDSLSKIEQLRAMRTYDKMNPFYIK